MAVLVVVIVVVTGAAEEGARERILVYKVGPAELHMQVRMLHMQRSMEMLD